MERLERFYRIDRMLRASRAVSSQALVSRLGVSISTLKRDLEYMRDRMNAPIEWDRELNGYKYVASDSTTFVLPGFWLHPDEIHALLMMKALLSTLGSGVLSTIVDPFTQRLEEVLRHAGGDPRALSRRFRVHSLETRPPDPNAFGSLATATIRRLRARICHHNRSAGITSDREISPQRLIFHRGKWYVDAWCHLRKGLRRFAIDAIQTVQVLDVVADELPDTALEVAGGYGIFGGRSRAVARLRFSPHRARWVARDQWHPEQKVHFQKDGFLLVTFPYADDRELVRDLLRHGADVQVLGPVALRERLLAEIRKMASMYPS